MLMVFWSSFTILPSLAVAYSRKRSWIPVRRPRKMMSTWETPFDRLVWNDTRPADLVFVPTSAC